MKDYIIDPATGWKLNPHALDPLPCNFEKSAKEYNPNDISLSFNGISVEDFAEDNVVKVSPVHFGDIPDEAVSESQLNSHAQKNRGYTNEN